MAEVADLEQTVMKQNTASALHTLASQQGTKKAKQPSQYKTPPVENPQLFDQEGKVKKS